MPTLQFAIARLKEIGEPDETYALPPSASQLPARLTWLLFAFVQEGHEASPRAHLRRGVAFESRRAEGIRAGN